MENNEDKNFKSELVSQSSLDELRKGHELKYIETIIEIEEEQKLVDDNMADFQEYSEEIQKKATEEFPKAQADQEYFENDERDKEIDKPLVILSNIKNKENEVKIKTWKAGYHARVIKRIEEFSNSSTSTSTIK